MSESKDPLRRLLDAIGYDFANPRLLTTALTHRSYVNESDDPRTQDNERLEFLGDAVLDLIVSSELMSLHPAAKEGTLSRIRASIVNETSLAELARKVELGPALRLGRGEELTGGRDRSSLLADAFEAVLAAIYLDGGFDAARLAVLPLLELPEPGRETRTDPKTELQERLQSELKMIPSYRVKNEEGPDHDKVFVVEVVLGEVVVGEGKGRAKKEAERMAAASVLEMIEADPQSFEQRFASGQDPEDR